MLFKYDISKNKSGEINVDISIIQTPKNYTIKDITIVQKNTLLVLLASNYSNESNDKPHSIIGMIYTDKLNMININEKTNHLKVVDIVISRSNVIYLICCC